MTGDATRLQRLVSWCLARPVRNGILFATLLCLPMVFSGWMLDDWIHRAAILGRIPFHHPSPTSLFNFGNGVKADVMQRTAFGYGWWTLPDLRLNFFRPLSALTHMFDELVLGPHAWLHHLHSFAWQAAGIGVAAALLRRLLAPRTAALATLLYAVDDGHWTATCWLSNRNAWVSMVPAMLGFWAWLRAEDEDWLPGKIAAPLLFAIGLCGGETALGVAAIWVTVALGRKPQLRTLLHLAPLGVVLAAWAAYYKTHGYGATASGAYLDPASEPLRFLAEAAHRVPTLAGVLFSALPAELSVTSAAVAWPMALAGVTAVAVLIVALRRLPLAAADAKAWPALAVGGCLALFPPAATWPSQRTLLATSLVSAALLAMLILGLGDLLATQPGLRLARWGRGVVVGVHLVLLPVATFAVSCLIAAQAPVMARLAASPVLTGLGGKHVVLLAAPDPVLSFYLPALMASSGLALPAQFNTLAVSVDDVAVTRTGPNRIRLEAQLPKECPPLAAKSGGCYGAPLLSTQPEQLIMDPARMPKAGDVLEVPHLRVHVEKASAAGVSQVEFEFEAPLEQQLFLGWHMGALQVVPPPVPERTVIHHEIGVMGI